LKFDRFVGLDYVDQGRSFNGVDCYGLLRLVYIELLGIFLPSYDTKNINSEDRKATADLISGELDPWLKIEVGLEIPLDAVLVRVGRDVMHIGLVTVPGKMLHIEDGDLSKIEPYRTGKLKHRIAGFYRYRGK
jgi:cell wall-associated NlpC family hydrolase